MAKKVHDRAISSREFLMEISVRSPVISETDASVLQSNNLKSSYGVCVWEEKGENESWQ